MVVMTSLMKSPNTSPNNQNVSLIVLQVKIHEEGEGGKPFF